MNIAVFIKQVPDTIDVKINPKTGNLEREGIESTINLFDLHAIEAAIQLKEQHGGKVTVLTMGPLQAQTALKKALAMGCDEAVLLSDRKFAGADTLATGYVLAKAAEKIGPLDVLLFGRHAVDADTGQTGPIVASFLDLPQVTFVRSITVDGSSMICQRALEHCIETVKVSLPVLLTVTSELNDPRYATPINIMKAGKKPQFIWSSEELGCDEGRIGQAGSPSIVRKIYEPVHETGNLHRMNGSIEEIAAALVDLFEEQHLI
ncbi:electron transfer flavoprotein subunit beta [Enterococcus florum]|uniref:Electron transfer flavoprotein small subunit n=1 Tax=Enterococcus florum TaxID=2480627 RepID=A0A4P5P8Q6_9ENTE|nr:electron transfer flavoprotein subunit beta/FixA family protein [Enterococcus florum]GCF92664.1 electron transfer flavoprotein subunit beta [Enterococcus florum]